MSILHFINNIGVSRMAKLIVSNWVTSAFGLTLLGLQVYKNLMTGEPLNTEVVLCAIGFLGAKDGAH